MIYRYLIALALIAILLATCQAVELTIQGYSSGTGWHQLSFAGDLLNVSILQNPTSWNVSVGGVHVL